MISLGNLKPAAGSVKNRKRIGRGPGSGFGKTAGRGMNGQKSRSGFSRKRGFEGGQMPLVRRVPKRGFTNIFRKEYAVINVGLIEELGLEEITPEILKEMGVIKGHKVMLKILGEGDLSKKVVVKAHKFSKTAEEKIKANSGEIIIL